ncbi:hypothetical protein CEQ90_08235 [Lewinellaceae bacterium SD302]|nr:hypothetical protein CEQ90_08235 [Lewinellaceae bacterium SD302]
MFGLFTNKSDNPSSLKERSQRAFNILLLGFGLLLLALFGAWLSQYNNARAEDNIATELLEQSRLEELLSKLQQAESAQRGYLLTSNTTYLRPFQDVSNQIPHLLDQIQSKADESNLSMANIRRLRSLTNRKMREMAETIRLKDSNRAEEAIALVNEDIGKVLMDSIRLEVAALRLSGFKAYRRNDVIAKRTENFIFGLELLSVVILLMILYYIHSVIQSLFLKTQAANEELKAQRAALRDKNSQLERFAYIASHDLNEPLRTISSFVDVFHEEQADRLDSEGKQYLNFIQKAAERMRGLVNGMLQFARIGRSGQMVDIDVNKLIRTIAKDLSVSIEKNRATLDYAELPVISGYRTEIRQLFQNLILNAIKYNEGTPNVKISCIERTSHWEFCVADNGIGIAPDHQERIFGMFSRLHRSDDYPGQGIGLAFCKRIVELHGGEIWLASREGQGSEFYFTIAKDNSHVTPIEQYPSN